MSVINYYKAISYAYSLPEIFKSPNILEETSLTLITHYFPRKLTQHIEKKYKSLRMNLRNGINKDMTEGFLRGSLKVFPKVFPKA